MVSLALEWPSILSLSKILFVDCEQFLSNLEKRNSVYSQETENYKECCNKFSTSIKWIRDGEATPFTFKLFSISTGEWVKSWTRKLMSNFINSLVFLTMNIIVPTNVIQLLRKVESNFYNSCYQQFLSLSIITILSIYQCVATSRLHPVH